MDIIYRNNKGIGLLELMLALAIIAVLIIMATRYYQTTARASRISEGVAQFNAIVGAAEQYKIGQGSYEAITIAKLTAQGLLPPSAAKSPWGTQTVVGPWPASGPAHTIYVRYLDISRSDCNVMIARMKGNNVQEGGMGLCTIDYVSSGL